MKYKRIDKFDLIFSILGGAVLLFIIAPLFSMVINTPTADLVATAAETEVQSSIFLTLWCSMTATILFALSAIPMAYLLARKQFRGKRLIIAIIDLPIVIPHSAAGIAILGFISRDSTLGKTAGYFGTSFVGGTGGIMLAMAFVSIPFLLNAARNGFLNVPVRLEKAALNLGASPLRVFFTVSLPLAWRDIVSGLVLMWARGLSEFGAIVIVAYHPMVTPVMIFERFGAYGLKYARPVSVIFIAVCLVLFMILRLLAKERSDVAR
jgi:molybdate/tungstate transport system permease protein